MNLVTRTTFSCNGCTKRYVGCHSTCKIHKEEKEMYDNKVKTIKKAKHDESDVIGFLTVSMLKTKRLPIPERTK